LQSGGNAVSRNKYEDLGRRVVRDREDKTKPESANPNNMQKPKSFSFENKVFSNYPDHILEVWTGCGIQTNTKQPRAELARSSTPRLCYSKKQVSSKLLRAFESGPLMRDG
jgi:hypothetical protein